MTTKAGKLCRKLLLKYQELCKLDAEFDEEDLPNITVVPEDEHDVVPKKKNFKSLFFRRRESNVISQLGAATPIG